MTNPVKAYKAASLQTKIFWILAIGFGLLTVVYCFYPYIWFDLHRSGKEYPAND